MIDLAILSIVIPLLSAPLCFIFGRGHLSWLFTFLVVASCVAINLLLAKHVATNGTIYYELGNWFVPIGIQLKLDSLAVLMLLLVSGLALITLCFARDSIAKQLNQSQYSGFYAMFLLCLSGLSGISATNDAFNLFVFLEITSLATYSLIAMGNHRKALVAGFEYLILGTIGATFYLIGVGLLYGLTGTLNMSDLAHRIAMSKHVFALEAAFAFLIVGLALKSALFPLHHWLVQSYATAPNFVASFLAGTATKVSVVVLMRIIFIVFGLDLFISDIPFHRLLEVFSLAAIVVGSLAALASWNIKRMFAYSSVAQIGFILLGVSVATPLALAASLLHLINHAIAKSALFLGIGLIEERGGGYCHLDDCRGLGRAMPWTSAFMVLSLASIIGIPLTAGFVSKWILGRALVAHQSWISLAIVVLGSLASFAYSLRLIEVLYFKDRPADYPNVKHTSFLSSFPLVVLGGLTLVFGLLGATVIPIAYEMASTLLWGIHVR